MQTRPIRVALALYAGAVLGGCTSSSDIRGGTASIVRSATTTSPVQARQVTTRETLDPATGVVTGREVTTRVEGGGETASSHINAHATGASGRATGKDISQSITGTPPELNLPEGGAKGGSVRGAADVLSGGDAWPLYALGGLAILAGLVACYLRQLKPGLALVAAGCGLILVAFYPAVLWVLIGLGLVAGCLWIWDAKARADVLATLGRVARGVKSAPADAASLVKAAIDKTTTDADDLRIAEAKRKEGV